LTTESDMAPAPLRAADFSLDFPFSLGRPVAIAGFRTLCADFVVEEELGFTPEGGGEHLYLHIRKENQNTRWVAKLLAEYFAVEEQAVGYSGLKDRHAITSQWFSIHLPGAENPLPLPIVEGCEILASSRHPRKLRPGTHLRNHFEIRLRDVSGSSRQEIDARLEAIVVNGVPNYFGEQRFGIDGGNLREVEKILAQRQPRFKGRRGGQPRAPGCSTRYWQRGCWITAGAPPRQPLMTALRHRLMARCGAGVAARLMLSWRHGRPIFWRPGNTGVMVWSTAA